MICEEVETLHHQTGVTYGRQGFLATWRSMFRAEKMTRRQETIASLGDVLALGHHTISLEGFAEAHIAAVGPVEIDEVALFEVDERGRTRRFDLFPVEKLGDAVARLYERHAELLPDGPERERAAATARSLAGWSGPIDPDRLATTMTPSMEMVDHRNLGTWSTRGAAEFLDHNRLQAELATGFTGRTDGVLALAPDALLVRCTYFGIARDSGGAFENVLLQLFAFGADGLIARSELWEPDLDAEALARFDALTADARHADTLAAGIQEGGADSRPKIAGMTQRSRLVSGRRVRPNAATAWWARFDAALAVRDFDAVAAGTHEEHQAIDHPTGSEYGRDAAVASLERLFRSRDPYYELESLATLGERLVLTRRRSGASGDTRGRYDVGPYETEAINLGEVDGQGLFCREEIFAADRLGDALVRLYERHAELLPEGPERTRAAGLARTLAALNGRIDLDRLRATLDPSFRCIDHRVFGTWSTGDAEEHMQHFRLQLDLAPDFAGRYDEVFAANARAVVARMTYFGTARDSGGPFENKLGHLFTFGADGRFTHSGCWEAEQVAEALARFDELSGGDTDAAADWFENAAARTDRELFERFNARDWAGVEALAAPALVFDERRRMLHNTCGRDVWLEQFRVLYDVPASRFTTKFLGTRGERLSLSLHRFTGEVAGGGGPLEMDDHLVLHEVDVEGRLVAIVLFDLEDEDAAWGEVDARFEAGEGAAHPASCQLMRGFDRAVARRDWNAVAALCAESLVEYDHRSLAVLGTTRGPEAWARNFSTLVDLSPDAVYRIDHFRAGARGCHSHGSWHGTREGGPYEMPLNAVLELDARGQIVRADIYDDDGVEAALARFAELTRAPNAPERFANAATATAAPVIAHMIAHDWPGFEQLFAETFRMSDRRRVVQLELDRDQYVAFTREIANGRAIRARSEIVATRGERLALTRSTFEFTDGDVGPSEVVFLLLTQVDEHGRIGAYVRWDLEDLGAAYAELDARWAAHDAAEHPRATQWLNGYLHAFAARDWTAMSALFTPDLVGENHRLVGWGTRHGPEGVVSTLRAQIELAPDTQERVDHVRTGDGAVLFEYAWLGTREGGAFENVWLVLIELAPDGRARRADVWQPEQLDQARARFETIAASKADAGAFISKTTAAIAAMERFLRSFDAQDWDAVRAACSSRFTWDDRRPIVGMSGDVELMIASARERLASGARHERREVIGTAGDRVAISRTLWAGGPADGRFEVEFLVVHEIDADGLFTAHIFFDPDDPRVAQREAFARWTAIDPTVAEVTAHLDEVIDGWNAKDVERLRAAIAEDLVAEDHRWTGTGRSEGREAYLRSVMALWELAPESRIEGGWIWLAIAPHGAVYACRRSGTLPGGGEFVSDFLTVIVLERARVKRLEVFEMDAADAALARFAELRPDPLRIPPNAVARAYERWLKALGVGDEDAVMALYAPSYVIEDRRSLFRTSSDLEEEIGNVRWAIDGGWKATRTLLATAGDRLALHRIVWRSGEGSARSETCALHVDEVDGDGRLLRSLMFDADDRTAACRELGHRYLGITRPSALPQHEARHDAGRDLACLRAALPDDFFFHDHRRTGLGRLDGADAYVASVAALHELAPDATVGQPLHYLIDEPHGALSIAHSFGTLADGGAFESVYVMITLYGPDGMAGVELFELDDLEAAKARFAELRTARTG